MTHNKLLSAMRFALYTGAASAAMLVAPAYAQTDTASTDQLETVVVTGSRIRKADIETAKPVLTIDRAQIEHGGFNSVADILLTMTSAGSPALSRSDVLLSGESVGGSYIDLRDLGPERTLVLVNGKRLGTDNNGYQDLGAIPTGVIERIDVLKDGASAIYGSDAIAGVINIITRTKFEGAEANFYAGQYDEDDGQKQSADFTIGSKSDRTSLTMSASYSKEDPVFAKDRFFSETPFPGQAAGLGWSGTSQWGSISNWVGRTGPQTLNPNSTNPLDPNNFIRLTSDRFANSNEQMMLLSELERRSLFVDGSVKITDWLNFRSDALYNKRTSTAQVAGYPLTNATTYRDGVNGVVGPISINSYFNPIGNQHGYSAPQSANFSRRGWEVPRVTESNLTSYRFTGGFDGMFEVGSTSWNWDAGFLFNKNETVKYGTGNLNLINLARAIGPSFMNAQGVIQCGTAAAPISLANCVPANPLLPFGVAGPGSFSNQDVQDFIYYRSHTTGETKTIDYTANLSGSVLQLPAGDLNVAVGFEYRREQGSYEPDTLAQEGATTDLAAGPTGGRYNVKEFYAEVNVPIFKDLPFARELTVDMAARRSKYDTFGSTTNASFGLKWKPIDDLAIRGTYGEGFRAPTIGDLYGGTSQTFATYRDPCSSVGRGNAACSGQVAGIAGVPSPATYQQIGQAGVPCGSQSAGCQTGFPFTSGANPFLQPEFSKGKTAGFIYSPSYLDGFEMTLDWFKIKVENTVSSDTPNDVLEDCYLSQIQSRCQNVTRDPVTGIVTNLIFGSRNLGWIETEGYDLGLRYRLPETSIGKFSLTWETTYNSKWDSQSDPEDSSSPVTASAGWYSTFRYKSNFTTDWSLGDFGATWTVRHYAGGKEDCYFEDPCTDFEFYSPYTGADAYPIRKFGANTFHDLQFRYTLPWNGTVSAGANNAFGHVGPVLYSTPNSQFTYYGGFDIGRFYYVRYQQRF